MDWLIAQKELGSSLVPLYGDREAAVIADWVMETLSGKKKLDRLALRGVGLSPEVLDVYERYRRELLACRPVQYVLGESWFAGMRFFVDERVLIPRPETEELVEWAAATVDGSVLDVGTGSGCIAVSLARKRGDLRVMACDVSEGALAVAERNSASLGTAVEFFSVDFLDRGQWERLPGVRWVVSNPPYIPAGEGGAMAPHVIDYEPSTALFVPDGDALVFYGALAEFVRDRAEPGGGLFVEIHEDRGPVVCDLLSGLGARKVELRKDLQGKDRMIKATW
ncbi:MAG TPA: peptide chain release factor N(5)-glutamine methyltransferase [Puia sp.]|uniref:peptide chain release factor N(5)-glutamine methyltransferase n=1 Tax=Puia sp. TaxID=2045100 RepID=UPI002CF71B21|nr:peptide chain release factor N(5)-glutamine methyltransferase [Puia sp.]HVU93929.1 peptide chain release factor N(5)-glutamine methyltransferase [Puia sp.]